MQKAKIISVFLAAFACAVLIRLFVVEGFVVVGDSMAPIILSGDYVFINKLVYISKEPQRGDIIVALPRGESFRIIKRVIALPGERFSIEEGKVVIRTDRLDPGITLEEDYLLANLESDAGAVQYKLDPEEYFVLGDNSVVSIDSRELGFIDKWHILGRAFGVFRLKSFKYIGL